MARVCLRVFPHAFLAIFATAERPAPTTENRRDDVSSSNCSFSRSSQSAVKSERLEFYPEQTAEKYHAMRWERVVMA